MKHEEPPEPTGPADGQAHPVDPSRRGFFRLAGAAAVGAAAQATPLARARAPAPDTAHRVPPQQAYTFLNAEEAAFIEAAVDRLIPADANGPGARDADVAFYIDRQLGGAWGGGERLYRGGPFHAGVPTQGYQLPLTPAELFRHALRGAAKHLADTGKPAFAKMAPADQDAYLKELESGKTDLDGVPSNVFFSSLLEVTIEGYFADPVYGGNRDMAAWKMIGFPGAYASFYELVDQHGMQYRRAPISLAEDARGVIRIHPNIPATPRNGGK